MKDHGGAGDPFLAASSEIRLEEPILSHSPREELEVVSGVSESIPEIVIPTIPEESGMDLVSEMAVNAWDGSLEEPAVVDDPEIVVDPQHGAIAPASGSNEREEEKRSISIGEPFSPPSHSTPPKENLSDPLLDNPLPSGEPNFRSSPLTSPSASSTGTSGSGALDSQPPNAKEMIPRRPADHFLALRAGEWYLCQVVSFVSPENFYLRFPFGDTPLWDFDTQSDDDSVFAIYPSTTTTTTGSRVRCLQREIDRHCAVMAAEGRYLNVEEEKDAVVQMNGEGEKKESPLFVGARLLTRQEDGSFFRSVVKEIKKDAVSVFLLDFGGAVHVERKNENFMAMPEDFNRMPRMALRGRLANVKPKGGAWSLEAFNWFIDQVMDGY